MSYQNIHCPTCKGTRKVYSSGIGMVTCLNCAGRGIVRITTEEYHRRQRAEEEAKQKAEEVERRNREMQAERMRLYEIATAKQEAEEKSRKQKEEDKQLRNNFTLVIVITIVLGGIGFLFQEEIINFFKQLLYAVAAIFFVLVFLAVFFGKD